MCKKNKTLLCAVSPGNISESIFHSAVWQVYSVEQTQVFAWWMDLLKGVLSSVVMEAVFSRDKPE